MSYPQARPVNSTVSPYQGAIYLGEEHYAWAKDGKVFMGKDSDDAYVQAFDTQQQLMSFVNHLFANAEIAWPGNATNHFGRMVP
jgi:hypothetical protein